MKLRIIEPRTSRRIPRNNTDTLPNCKCGIFTEVINPIKFGRIVILFFKANNCESLPPLLAYSYEALRAVP